MKTTPRRGKLALTLIAGAVLTLANLPASASSHREGPFITNAPKVDGTDLYLFRSYEPTRENYVTVIADYIPFQDPQGGPNFYQFDQNALYEIHFDNNGDAKEDLTFQFRFKNTPKSTTLPVNGKNIRIPVINSGVISGINPASLNVRETYTVGVVRGERRGSNAVLINNPAGGTDFDKPVDNIGDKSFGSATGYEAYANQHIYNVNIPNCGAARIFVGQRKEPFFIAVGKIFDLINLNPLGAEIGGNKNDLEGKNISSIAMELPISCLVNTNGDPVVGAWTTASMRQGRLINPNPATGFNNAVKEGGAWAQVSRLGMPLVNEVVIGQEDKDRFNASKPRNDSQFADYVNFPALPAFIEKLYPTAKAPTNFPRNDLFTVFLTGLPTVNRPRSFGTTDFSPADMLRLNTSIAPRLPAAQLSLGVAAGDTAGFPNGRRPGDDVVDVSLRVAMGALCALTGTNDALLVGCKPSDAPAGGLAFTDGVRKTATDFKPGFPYLNTPLPGNQ